MPVTSTETLKKLLPDIKARRDEIEKTRHLPADIAQGLKDARVWAQSVPKAVGGDESAPTDIMRTIETVATADGSAGWCTMIGQGTIGGYMNEIGAKEIFGADPTISVAGIAGPLGKATRVDGGVKINGRWAFASGVTHSPWVWAGNFVFGDDGAPVMTPHGPEFIHVVMPKTDVEVLDTWFVSGLCGTGSNDFTANDVFVPDHRIFSLFDPSGHRQEPLYRFPEVALFVSGVASVGLGIARAALDEFAESAQSKMPAMSMVPLAQKPAAQIELARAEAALGGARSFLYDTIEDLWQTVTAGREPTIRQRGLARVAAVQVAETAAAVTKRVATLAGASALYAGSPLQRHARDAEALSHHFTMSAHTWEDAGRVFLGLQPTGPVF
jgi:alkylation response protein AidB-like acyl-CoA dehydrogenase